MEEHPKHLLNRLVEKVRAIECPAGPFLSRATGSELCIYPFAPDGEGWDSFYQGLPPAATLQRGAVHEWIGLAGDDTPLCNSRSRFELWSPPLCILTHLARRAIAATGVGGQVLWIGRRCWPYAHLLIRGRWPDLLGRSIFIDAQTESHRLWAMETALRCASVAVVVADGSRFNMTATRRLQLAAQAGGCLALLARPPWERGELSAARTRWMVQPAPGGRRPRWKVRLLRCKGQGLACDDLPTWFVEWNHEMGTVCLSSDLVHGPGQAKAAPGRAPALAAV